MPAFAKKHGGPFDDSQIRSLVAYLTRVFPREIKTKQAIANSLKEKDSVLKWAASLLHLKELKGAEKQRK